MQSTTDSQYQEPCSFNTITLDFDNEAERVVATIFLHLDNSMSNTYVALRTLSLIRRSSSSSDNFSTLYNRHNKANNSKVHTMFCNLSSQSTKPMMFQTSPITNEQTHRVSLETSLSALVSSRSGRDGKEEADWRAQLSCVIGSKPYAPSGALAAAAPRSSLPIWTASHHHPDRMLRRR